MGATQFKSLQTSAWLVGTLSLLLSAAGVVGQGAFQNLDFEQANIVPVSGLPSFYVYTVDALPGWTLDVGSAPQPMMYWNVPPASPITASIYQTPDKPVLQGLYSVWLMPVSGTPSLFPVLAQTGTIPAGAQSILVDSRPDSHPYTLPLEMGFAGQQIQLSVVSGSASTFYTYTGDISMFANQTGTLALWGDAIVDNIRFVVPEPSVFGLSALGALLVGWRILRRDQKRAR
jgi:hypothetical protein